MAILRWFQADGIRHRAYFRTVSEASATKELVVATREWEATDAALKPSLEDYSEEELISIAHALRGVDRDAAIH